MSTTPTPVEDDLDTGRMIASRWRPATLRTTPSKEDRGLFGHPRGLPWMLNVEMWERFSYYGMRAILLYFITDTVAGGGLGLSANSGQVILASYSAAVYLLAIPGGIFADRIIGPWLSTLYGGLVIMAGHICLSIPAPALAWTGSCWWPWAPVSSSRTCPRSSGVSTMTTTLGATPDSSCSTCRSTSDHWRPHW